MGILCNYGVNWYAVPQIPTTNRRERLRRHRTAGGLLLPYHEDHNALGTECGASARRSELTDEDIRTAIKNSGGVRGTLLIPDAPFELLVRRAIGRLLTPALQCKEFVHAELLRIAGQCAPPDIGRFPALQARPRGPQP
jgi:hypothetical protein